MSDKKNNYNPKKVRIYDEDLKKILKNNNNNKKPNNKPQFSLILLFIISPSPLFYHFFKRYTI